MSQDAVATVLVAVVGACVSWCAWASVSLFKHSQEIALLKQEIRVMGEIKNVLDEIRDQLRETARAN